MTVRQKIVHQDRIGKWYFWYEDWVSKSLPYNTEEECDVALDEYCRKILGYENDSKWWEEEK